MKRSTQDTIPGWIKGLEINYSFSPVTPRSFDSLFSFFCRLSKHIFLFLRRPFPHPSERDNFIKVNWDNIVAGAEVNFQQFNAYVSMFSTPYDYGRCVRQTFHFCSELIVRIYCSIMHYSPYAFSRNKSIPTIAPMKAPPNGEKLGQRDGKIAFLVILLLLKCCRLLIMFRLFLRPPQL